MLTQAQKEALPKKRANRSEIDSFYRMRGALTAMVEAEEALKARAQLIPGGWRDLRMIRVRAGNLLDAMKYTFDDDKRRSIERQLPYIRIRAHFGPEASSDPEMFMLPIEDFGVCMLAAAESCKVRMCSPAQCAQCQLGKVLDRASFITRGDRAWWEVFESSTRWDVGGEET